MELSSICSQDGNIVLYFVIPSNYTPETCTRELKCAYQACRENELSPVWLKSEECCKQEPTKQDVFICDPFEGVAFDYLLSGAFKCVRVLGPRCLLSCLHGKKPVPELPSPLHNIAMHELVITSTGFEKDEKLELQKLIERMSGIYSNNFHEGITHLIAKTVGSKKYMVAVEKETPIMTSNWVRAVWEAVNEDCAEDLFATHEQFSKYTCPVFQGLVVCISQMPRNEKESLKTLIENNGGTYSANLEMSVTSVLITPSSEGEKYKHAIQWRIPCLTHEWIHDCIEHGSALPMDDYKLVKKKSSTPTHDQSRVPPDVSICSTIMSDSIMNQVVDETRNMDTESIKKRHSTTDLKISKGVNKIAELDFESVLVAGGCFLDGCKIYLSGFDRTLSEKLRRILNAGGAIRFNTLTDAVSHIVLGKLVEEDMNKVKEWNSVPAVVTADWIVECIRQKRTVDETEFLYKDINDEKWFPEREINSKVKCNESNNDNSNNATFIDDQLIRQYRANKNVKGTNNNIANLDSLDCSTLPDSQQTMSEGIFKGKVFTVSGYAEDTEEQLIELISGNGGEVAKIDYPKPVHYSIISVDGEGATHPMAFNYVTYIFIEDCLEQEILVPVEFYHLPFVWPDNLYIIEDCVIAMSSYKGKERLFLSHIVTRMGALYQDMFAKKDNESRGVKCSTHLLCPLAEGEKYVAASKWGVPAVTKDWVLKCAEEGVRVPLTDFRVDAASDTKVDGIAVLLKLLGQRIVLSKESINGVNMKEKENDVFLAPTPINKNIRDLKQKFSSRPEDIKTPDQETIRRMYPTPGGVPKEESLDTMPTPETPYGSTWFPNPSSRIRKSFKRALDALPDDQQPSKRPFTSATPEEVYYKKFATNLKDFIDSHPMSKLGDKESSTKLDCKPPLECVEENNMSLNSSLINEVSAEVHGPLTGVIVYASQKLSVKHKDLYYAVQKLGGDYRWTYDKKVTHFIHTGRLNDTNREFRMARDQEKFLVSPEWVWMCMEENCRVDESLFPHNHNPKMSLSLVMSKGTPLRKKRGRGRPRKEIEDMEEDPDEDRTMSEDCSDHEEEEEKKREFLSRQLEELEAITGVRRSSSSSARNRSITEKLKNTPNKPIEQQPITKPISGNTESESQNTAITWDDPQEREARARLEGALEGHTQDIIHKKMQEENENCVHEEKNQNLPNSTRSSYDPSCYCFVLSGTTEDMRQYYADIIICLGGKMCHNQQSFDSSVTHIITNKPSRSEKHLAAIASGKWILYYSFLDESREKEQFVKEEEHEWGNKKATSLPTYPIDSIETKLGAAAHRWRVHYKESGKGAFHSMKVIIYSSKERTNAFTRLVEAGDGVVLSNLNFDFSDVTHCLVELNKAGKVDLAAFAAQNIPCMFPIYLNEFLVTYPPPDEMDNCIPEYKQIINDMTLADGNISLRKRKK